MRRLRRLRRRLREAAQRAGNAAVAFFERSVCEDEARLTHARAKRCG